MTIKGWRAMLVAAVVGLAMWAGIAWAVLGSASAEDSDSSHSESVVEDTTGSQRVRSSTGTVVPCPTEDSCSVDYHDGAYHITRVIP